MALKSRARIVWVSQVCVYVYKFIHVYIHMYIYVDVYLNMYVNSYIYIFTYMALKSGARIVGLSGVDVCV